MTWTFSLLPTEVTELIASSVEPTDLLSLRLSSKALKTKSLRAFTKAWFTSLETDLSARSVKRLESISKDSSLSPVVRTLILKSTVPRQVKFDQDDQLIIEKTWLRLVSGRLRNVRDHPHMISLRRILSERFLNCRSFCIVRGKGPHMRDFREEYFDDLFEEYLDTDDMIEILFSIIIDTHLRPLSFRVSWGDAFLQKQPEWELYAGESFWTFWTSLEVLHVNTYQTGAVSTNLEMFLSHKFPALQSLSLALDFEKELLDRGLLDKYALSDFLPIQLQDLTVSEFWVSQTTLNKLILGSRHTLKSVVLRQLALGGNVSDFAWHSIVADLRDKVPNLESVELDDLSGFNGGDYDLELAFHKHMYFPGLGNTLGDSGSVSVEEYFRARPRPTTSTCHKYPDASSSDRLATQYGTLQLIHYGERSGTTHVRGVKYEGQRMRDALDHIAESMSWFHAELPSVSPS